MKIKCFQQRIGRHESQLTFYEKHEELAVDCRADDYWLISQHSMLVIVTSKQSQVFVDTTVNWWIDSLALNGCWLTLRNICQGMKNAQQCRARGWWSKAEMETQKVNSQIYAEGKVSAKTWYLALMYFNELVNCSDLKFCSFLFSIK